MNTFRIAKMSYELLFTENNFLLCSTKPGLILENKGMRAYNQKRARKPSKRAQLWVFTPPFSKFRAFGKLQPLNGICFWSFW